MTGRDRADTPKRTCFRPRDPPLESLGVSEPLPHSSDIAPRLVELRAAQPLRSEKRRERGDADALRRPAEQLPPGEEEVAFVLGHRYLCGLPVDP